MQLSYRMGQITSYPFLVSFFTCVGIYLTFHLMHFLVTVARRRSWLIGLHSSTVAPIHGGDAALPPAAAGGISSQLALDAIKDPTAAPAETRATSEGGGGKLPMFEVAVQSKLLVGPHSYEKRELAK